MSRQLAFFRTTMVNEVLEGHKDVLFELSQQIWLNPEENFQEHFAHDTLTSFLEIHGFTVFPHYKNLPTAFRAEFHSENYDKAVHPTICIICEYDALPEIGHACGHNLIAEAGVAAGLAVKRILTNASLHESADRLDGRVVVLGAPAEEGGGGKIILVNAGAFQDIDFAMMVHPSAYNDLEATKLGVERCLVDFHGKAAHASCGPWEGVNALDAAVAVYQQVSLFRQQFRARWRVHGVILNGGTKANIIPDFTRSSYYLRAETAADLNYLHQKMVEIFNCAASTTGCTVKVHWESLSYSGMIHCSTMSQLYKNFSAMDDVMFPDHHSGSHGSTDMGNVSLAVPSIHPGFYIGQHALIHTKQFQRLAGGLDAQKYTLTAAKSMALTAMELFANKAIRDQAKNEFEQKKKLFIG